MKPTGNLALDKALRRVCTSMRGLDGTANRPRARKNARARVLGSMRSLRATLDREYPSIKTPKKVVRLKTFDGRLARLENAGWKLIEGSVDAGWFAAAGVPVKHLVHKDPDGSSHGAWLAPAWAVVIGNDPAKLRAAKKSRALQHAARTVAALREPSE